MTVVQTSTMADVIVKAFEQAGRFNQCHLSPKRVNYRFDGVIG